MAIRNINAINNSLESIKHEEEIKVEHTKMEFQLYYDSIMSKKQDIIDAIDTYKYCIEKGLEDRLNEFFPKVKKIGFECDMLSFQFNEWKSENSGPYNWFVLTDGDEVFIRVNSSRSDVPTMIKNTLYKRDGYDSSRDIVIAPIYEVYGGKKTYTCHSAEKPLSALKEFDRILPQFLANFFDKVDNLA